MTYAHVEHVGDASFGVVPGVFRLAELHPPLVVGLFSFYRELSFRARLAYLFEVCVDVPQLAEI